jgi:hypothetical protein
MGELRLRADSVHWQEIDGELVALEARSSQYLAANSAGTVLWRALAAGSTRERLAQALVDGYGIDLDRALADTDHFLAQLAEQGLLEPAGEPAGRQ